MGAADIVPGVSGGTIAFILGIYRDLIEALRSFDLRWIMGCLKLDFGVAFTRPHFAFLIPLLAGIFTAVMFFTRVVELQRLIHTHPEEVYGLFFGLVVASIVILMTQLGRLRGADAATLALGFIAGFVVVTAVPTNTPHEWWFILCCGAVAICAMVVPGISGSFVLLILGQYAYILDALGHFEWRVIFPFIIGAALGLMLFTRLVWWILGHFERHTLFGINGILIASLWVIWPFQERHYVVVRGKQRLLESNPQLPALNEELFGPIGLALLGFIAVIALERLAGRVRGA